MRPGTDHSIQQYPLYNGIADAFTFPGPRNMSSLVNYITQIQSSFNVRRLALTSLSLLTHCPDRTLACLATSSRTTTCRASAT